MMIKFNVAADSIILKLLKLANTVTLRLPQALV